MTTAPAPVWVVEYDLDPEDPEGGERGQWVLADEGAADEFVDRLRAVGAAVTVRRVQPSLTAPAVTEWWASTVSSDPRWVEAHREMTPRGGPWEPVRFVDVGDPADAPDVGTPELPVETTADGKYTIIRGRDRDAVLAAVEQEVEGAHR